MKLQPEFISANPFGVKMVMLDSQCQRRVLLNDSTRHGSQSTDPALQAEPLDYYHRSGPLGDVFTSAGSAQETAQIAVVGLGVGAMAAYAQSGQHFTFFEIDPGVADIATNPDYFTFLSRCRGTYEIVIGDAFATLNTAPDGRFGRIILDAFSSDAIPKHLVTSEALDLYLRKLNAGGLLVVHISNVHVALEPVISRLAAGAGLTCLTRADLNVSDEERAAGKRPSHYVALTRKPSDAEGLAECAGWTSLC